ncbi:MAG: uroporphyrinogen decarboxylase family protein [Bacillota bacterium]|jgi:uroporphyrinogen decarboxylase
MHKDDQMTPKERAQALSEGKPVDRMPIGLMAFAPSPRLLNLTSDALFSNGRTFANCQKKLYETFGQDGVTAKYGLHSMGIAFGATALNPKDSARAIINHPIKDIRDLSILDLDKLTPEKDKDVLRTYESAQYLLDELGNEVGCTFGATGPFTCACALMGAERLMRAVAKYPEELHKLLRFTTDAMIQITKPFLLLGCSGIAISEPMGSGMLMSEKNFRKFVLPYMQEYVAACKAVRPVGCTLHICGDTTKLLEAMADCNVDVISLDNLVDIAVARERIGNRVKLMGNVQPIGTLLFGKPADVEAEVKSCFCKGWGSPKGFLISPGCDAPYATPIENLHAYMDAARKCAKYPVNPDNFI